MKVLQLTALDGSKWNIPVDVIARDHAAYYAPIDFDGDVERSLRDGTLPLFAEDEFEVREWASNNMNWSDVKAHAVLVSGPEPVNMEDSWMEGEKRVVDAPDAPRYSGDGLKPVFGTETAHALAVAPCITSSGQPDLSKLKDALAQAKERGAFGRLVIDSPHTSFSPVTVGNPVLRPSLEFIAAADNPRMLFAIHNDGRVEIGEGVSLDEATRAFWDNVKQMGERMGIAIGRHGDAAETGGHGSAQ